MKEKSKMTLHYNLAIKKKWNKFLKFYKTNWNHNKLLKLKNLYKSNTIITTFISNLFQQKFIKMFGSIITNLC